MINFPAWNPALSGAPSIGVHLPAVTVEPSNSPASHTYLRVVMADPPGMSRDAARAGKMHRRAVLTVDPGATAGQYSALTAAYATADKDQRLRRAVAVAQDLGSPESGRGKDPGSVQRTLPPSPTPQRREARWIFVRAWKPLPRVLYCRSGGTFSGSSISAVSSVCLWSGAG